MSHSLPACCHGDRRLRHRLYLNDDGSARTEGVFCLATRCTLHHHTWWQTKKQNYNDGRQTNDYDLVLK